MTDQKNLTFYDRQSRSLKSEPIYARGFLNWCYNTHSGRLVTDWVLCRKWVSQAYGWWHKQPISRRRIPSFVKKLNVNTDELRRPIDSFESFNDFFTREIDLKKRPIHPDSNVCIAPADGRVLAYPTVCAGQTFRIKRSCFNLREFLGDQALAAQFDGGAICVIRLYLSDYHRFHFPDSGTPEAAVAIPGRYYAVSPYSLRRLVPFYTENYRMRTLFHSDHFGPVAMVEVGAFTVGSIQQLYRPEVHVEKSAQKGFFEIGGSTVVLVFQKGAISLDEDLCANTCNEIETYVRLGDSLGRTGG